MAQFTIYLQSTGASERRSVISDAIHRAAQDALGLPEDKRFQRFIPVAPDDFIYPDDRSDAYMIVEVKMFAGRTADTKRGLIRALYTELCDAGGISQNDLEIVIVEAPMADWGIRGMCGDELSLPYDVRK